MNKIGAFLFWLLLGQLVYQYFPKKILNIVLLKKEVFFEIETKDS